MASARVRLFVYGSLKRGGRHHDELRAVGATFLGEGATAPGYRLEALDATEEYVALVPTETEPSTARAGSGRPTVETAPDVVRGELFEVPESCLPALDAFEGDGYTRSVLKVRLLTPAKPPHEAQHQAQHHDGAAKPRHHDGAAKPRHQDEDGDDAAFEDSLAYFKKAR